MISHALLCCAATICATLNTQPSPTQPHHTTTPESRSTHTGVIETKPSITTEDVRFVNTHDDITLAGTLTIPQGPGPFPAAVLVSGSGPHDRDANFMGHPLFKVLAEHLAQSGIAVLRYDDRGVGESEGDFPNASPPEFATDALAAVEYLAGHPSIANDQIGILGHSEGAIAALIAADASDKVAFLISLAGPGIPGIDGLKASLRATGKASGVSPKVTRLNLRYFTALTEIVTSVEDKAEAERLMKERVTEISKSEDAEDLHAPGSMAPAMPQIIDQLNEPNARFVFQFDPQPVYARLNTPTLVLFGRRDPMTPYRIHAAAIKSAFDESDAPDATVESLPHMNHIFQKAKTGSPAEFGQIKETMSPAALETISSWINERFGQE